LILGIGVQMYDFLVPLYGSENLNSVKNTTTDPGSISLPISDTNNLKSEKEILSSLKQEGFGNLDESDEGKNDESNEVKSEKLSNSPTQASNSDEKIKKLGSVFQAMSKAKVQTSELKFRPKKQKQIGVKKTKKHSFHLV